jgi:site-specific recombinase
MVVELTRTPLAAGHAVNLGAVLLAMRKALQVDLAKGGYQSVCNSIHSASLGGQPAMETTCKITLNGGHVMTQTLLAATVAGNAWSLSYAGSAQGYSDNEAAVQGIRDSLKFNPLP